VIALDEKSTRPGRFTLAHVRGVKYSRDMDKSKTDRAALRRKLSDAIHAEFEKLGKLLVDSGARVFCCHGSAIGFVVRTDALGVALLTEKLRPLVSTFDVLEPSAAELRHFGAELTHVVRGCA
jgi:hypothetical protein